MILCYQLHWLPFARGMVDMIAIAADRVPPNTPTDNACTSALGVPWLLFVPLLSFLARVALVQELPRAPR